MRARVGVRVRVRVRVRVSSEAPQPRVSLRLAHQPLRDALPPVGRSEAPTVQLARATVDLQHTRATATVHSRACL